jgi:Uma2 family endonuclease
LESVIPELLVEVTSTNYATDLVTKRLAYARAGVANYWVCPDVRRRLAL